MLLYPALLATSVYVYHTWLHLCYNQLLSKLKLKTRTSYVAVSGTPGNPGCTVHGLTQGEVRYLQVFTIHPPSWMDTHSWIHKFLGIHNFLGMHFLGYTFWNGHLETHFPSTFLDPHSVFLILCKSPDCQPPSWIHNFLGIHFLVFLNEESSSSAHHPAVTKLHRVA